MPSTLWAALLAAPANAAICFVNLAIYAVMWNYRVELDHLAVSYDTAITQRQLYRVVTATFTHLNLLHVGFNVSALYGLGSEWEEARGTAWYLQTTVGFVILAGVFHLLITRVAAYRFPAWLQVSACRWAAGDGKQRVH